jgi:hypothetical protein
MTLANSSAIVVRITAPGAGRRLPVGPTVIHEENDMHPLRRRTGPSIVALAVAGLVAGCQAPASSPVQASASNAVEQLHVLRSLRVERTVSSTWCAPARAGFAPLKSPTLLEDRFEMWSVRVSPSDARITDARSEQVGELRTCLGFTTDPRIFNFYAEGRVGSIPVTGSGECAVTEPNFPEPGITGLRCHLKLRGMPAPYVGGLLTSNSVLSKAVLGLETDPPGYLHSSIATVRLWRAR